MWTSTGAHLASYEGCKYPPYVSYVHLKISVEIKNSIKPHFALYSSLFYVKLSTKASS